MISIVFMLYQNTSFMYFSQ